MLKLNFFVCSSIHASVEKQPYGGGSHSSITISHSTSTSSSHQVQHKVNQKTLPSRSGSPSGHSQTTIQQTSSSTSSSGNSQHTHHHTHTHHDRMSPSLMRLKTVGPPPPQANPHHLMIQPPNMGHHPAGLGKSRKLVFFFTFFNVTLLF